MSVLKDAINAKIDAMLDLSSDIITLMEESPETDESIERIYDLINAANDALLDISIILSKQ